MTQLLVSITFEKKKVGRGWGCGSEQAPLTHNEGHTLGYFAMYIY